MRLSDRIKNQSNIMVNILLFVLGAVCIGVGIYMGQFTFNIDPKMAGKGLLKGVPYKRIQGICIMIAFSAVFVGVAFIILSAV